MPILRRVANAMFPEEVDSVDVHRAKKGMNTLARHGRAPVVIVAGQPQPYTASMVQPQVAVGAQFAPYPQPAYPPQPQLQPQQQPMGYAQPAQAATQPPPAYGTQTYAATPATEGQF